MLVLIFTFDLILGKPLARFIELSMKFLGECKLRIIILLFLLLLLELQKLFLFSSKAICITEAWLNHTNFFTSISIPGYEFCCILTILGAGEVAIYVCSKFHYEVINDYDLFCEACTNLSINLHDSNKINFVIGTVYRYPTSRYQNFTESLNNSMTKLPKSNCIFYLLET